MNAQRKLMDGAADPDGKWLCRVGGLCALLLGLGYLITIPLYVQAGAMPSGGEARLRYLAGRTTVWWAILGLSVLTDILFVPVALALYRALRRVNRDVALLATTFVGLFVVLDLAVTWPNHAALIALSGDYAAAASGAQQAYVPAANYAAAVLGSTLEGAYSIVTLSIGIILISLVMLRGIFGKLTASVGLAAGILGIVSVAGPPFIPALGVAIIVASTLTTVWVVLVGFELYRLGRL